MVMHGVPTSEISPAVSRNLPETSYRLALTTVVELLQDTGSHDLLQWVVGLQQQQQRMLFVLVVLEPVQGIRVSKPKTLGGVRDKVRESNITW